jgi:hypothetical protein
MTQEEIRTTLVVLLNAFNHASTTASQTQEALQEIRDREKQIADKQRGSLGQNTVGQASIELADRLAKLLVEG